MVPTLLSLLITAAAGVVNATPIPRSDMQPCWTTYISLPGETCETIAMAFHITTTDVIQANTFLNCNDIWPGTPICVYGKSQVTVTGIPPVAPTTIPGGATCWANYRSVLGDTCDSIGSRFGITPDDVYKYNTFLNCNDIWDGTPISICVGEGTRTRTTVVNTPTAFPPSPTNACGTIRSLEGDTCDTIANRFQITAAEVYNRNSFVDCNNIWTNTPIVVCGPPPPVNFCWTTYSEEGDTCDIIANRLGISSADVWDKNRFVDCNNIWTHTPLVICARTSSTLAPTTTIAATPACQTVLSNPGDTCESIGARVQLSASEIYNHNTFLNCNDIWPNTPIDICRSSWPLETIVDVLNDLFPSGAARPTSLSSTVEGTTTSSSSSAEEYVIPTISPSSSTAEYVVPTPSSSSSSSAQEYVVPTSSSSSVAEYVVPTSSSSSVEEYVVPTPSSSSAEEYVVPTSSSSVAEYVVPTSSSSSAEEYVAPTSSSSVLEYVVPIEYIAPVRL